MSRPSLTLTVGAGRARPQGRRVEVPSDTGRVEALARALRTLPAEAEGWWSPGLFRGDRRRAELWEGAGLIGVDLDHHDAAGTHAVMPATVLARALAVGPPGNLAHATPRGLRLVFLLAEVATDPEAWSRAAQGACELARGWLTDAGLEAEAGQAGLRVDAAASCDRARLFFTPRATVGGEARTADVEVLRPDPYDVVELAAATPVASEELVVPQVSRVSHVADDPVAELDRAERYARGALAQAVARLQVAPKGQRNETLNAEAFSLARLPGIDAEQALQALIGAAIRAGLPESEAVRTARSGWEAGENRPRRIPPWDGRVPSAAHRTGAPPWVPFPMEALPRELRDLAEHGARSIGCDPSFVALPGLAALGAAIGATTVAEVKPDWLEPPVLWAAIVGRSGAARKSPAFTLAVDPLHAAERKHFADWRERMKGYERDLSRWKALPARQRAAQDQPTPPARQRAVVEDCTMEALVRALDESPRGVLLARDELAGWLRGFDLYRDGRKGADVPAWLSMHRAGPVVVDRISRAACYVEHAFVAVTGTIQQGTLRDCLTAALVEAGLAARILLTWPPDALRRWTAASVPAGVAAAWADAVGRLLAVPRIVDANGSTAPRRVVLAPEAQRLFAAWVDELGEWAAEAPDATAAALAKVEGCAARLALILALAEDPHARAIDAPTMARALTLARWLATEQERVYALLGGAQAREHDALLAWIVRQGGRASVREVTRGGPPRYRTTAAAAEAGLAALVADGAGRWEDAPPPETGRRPGRVFVARDSATRDETPQAESAAGPDSIGPAGDGAPDPSSHVAVSHDVEAGCADPPPGYAEPGGLVAWGRRP